jgi:outer membrane protein OmpA-like peptidoglycan-associated protein
VRAESLAIERNAAREKRNEKTRSDAEIRLAENKYADAQAQIEDLKAELARETRNRELAERDVQNYTNQVRDLREENGRLRDSNATLKVIAENAESRLAALEEEKKAIQQRGEKDLALAQIRAREGDLMNTLRTYGTVVRNERGIVLTLPESLWTNTRSGTLSMQADGKLSSLGEVLASNSAYSVAVESYTDSAGNPEAVQTLTDNRARTVADKIMAMGVNESRVTAKGYGASIQVAPNSTPANRAKNRRLQVILTLMPQ